MSLSEAQRAIVTLQSRALSSRESYTIDVLDRALDEVVRNYDNPKPHQWQVRSALANAAKVVQFRGHTVTPASFDDADNSPRLATVDEKFALFELRDWLERTPAVSSEERLLLIGLAEGEDASRLAQERGVPVQRMRERISRARTRARHAYAAEAAA